MKTEEAPKQMMVTLASETDGAKVRLTEFLGSLAGNPKVKMLPSDDSGKGRFFLEVSPTVARLGDPVKIMEKVRGDIQVIAGPGLRVAVLPLW